MRWKTLTKIPVVKYKNLQRHIDERGWLLELFREDEMPATAQSSRPYCDPYDPVMGYISMTNAGVIRGPHEHVEQTDLFIFPPIGEFELYLWDNREGVEWENGNRPHTVLRCGATCPTAVMVPPGVVHGYKCVSGPGISLNFPDSLYRGVDKRLEVDEIRHEDDPCSPFQIT
jgi:dTDP-4-dehydrorhamnose 3,5-epimerase